MRTERLVGTLLVVLGIFLFVVTQTGVGGEAIPLLIGAGFLIAYAVTRLYGLLVPGGILTGLGTGIVVATAGGPDTSVVLGLGLGFVSIYVISNFTRDPVGHWWPLIPGGVLTLVGLGTLPATEGFAAYIGPVALILVGAALLVGVRGRAHRPRP